MKSELRAGRQLLSLWTCFVHGAMLSRSTHGQQCHGGRGPSVWPHGPQTIIIMILQFSALTLPVKTVSDSRIMRWKLCVQNQRTELFMTTVWHQSLINQQTESNSSWRANAADLWLSEVRKFDELAKELQTNISTLNVTCCSYITTVWLSWVLKPEILLNSWFPWNSFI